MRRVGRGVSAAVASAIFLGFAPVFGKLGINVGLSPLSVVAWRTALAAALVLLVMLVFYRQYLYIFPAGLMGCALAGFINGAGSILYYMSLDRLSASVGQILYSLYPFFVALWLALDGQRPSWLTIFRMLLATLGIVLLTSLQAHRVDVAGILMMLGAAALYALHLPINQRVLYEVPAPTVTLYTLLAMSVTVAPVYLIFDRHLPTSTAMWWPVLGLTLVTACSRLALFLGIKHIGGMQTALLGLLELLVAVLFSHLWLNENLAWTQWLGAAFLAASLVLVRFERHDVYARHAGRGWLSWIRPPDMPRDAPWAPHE